jgi:tetratricopeptide (TPR) repeat protein
MHKDVEAILAKRFPSYQEPLRQVWTWNRESTADSLRMGEELARGLKSRYPNVLQVCFELSFSLVRQKRRKEALTELQSAARQFPILDEDCLCLLGRCHKDEGDDLLSQNLVAAAQVEYQAAEESYQKAYELRHDRFPGINIAGLRLIRASLLTMSLGGESAQVEAQQRQIDDLLRRSQETARELLANRASWASRLEDDNIWIPATQGEAHLLLQEWEMAAQFYRLAMSQDNRCPFHAETMKAQVVRLLAAFARLRIAPQGPIADSQTFFNETRQAAPA